MYKVKRENAGYTIENEFIWSDKEDKQFSLVIATNGLFWVIWDCCKIKSIDRIGYDNGRYYEDRKLAYKNFINEISFYF